VDALLGKNDYESAESKAREVVRIAPDSTDAHNWLGYVLNRRGQYESALASLARAAQLNRSNTSVYINWAEALFYLRDFEGAAEKARQAIRLDDASADAHTWLGYILRSQGNFDEAMAEHEKAIQINPHNVYGYLGWAEAMIDKADGYSEEERKDKYDAAEQKVRVAVENDRYSADARNLLGRVLRKKRLYKEAIAEHEAAAGLYRANVYAYTGLTEAYLALPDKGPARKANIEKALAAARKAVEIDPNSPDAHGELGRVLIAQGDYYKAKGDNDKARGEYDKAIEQFVESNRRNPSGAYAYVGWSNALREKDECDEAEKKARKAFELAPTLRAACDELNYVLQCRNQPTIQCN
jgi:tetratricopeptide (TPR) repeat protein